MQVGFYVTLLREGPKGPRVSYLLGPYATRDEAESNVKRGWAEACDIDPRCHWDAHGVTRVETYPNLMPKPVLANRIGLQARKFTSDAVMMVATVLTIMAPVVIPHFIGA
ncbi:hypothetical protein [Novosphingobium sp. FKTRR1]|uniref:hypothetical protein n=1 Tax=Novosphingobium sp. FKTRR1 TaxID=2879118 RepID=UPI001CF05E3A|nr:hypothetical protein [Novosphingobium sp. FKTRR1]